MWTLGVDRELRLVQMLPEHAGDIAEVVTADFEHLSPFLPWVNKEYSVDKTVEFIEESIEKFEKGIGLQATIRESGRIIGAMGFNNIDGLHDSAEIGYWLIKENEGRGIVTKSAETLISFGFAELGLHRIMIRCATENKRSQAIPKRLGFTFEGVMRESERLHSGYVDLRIYSLLKHEFTA